MNQVPLVSIILPLYNAELYIEEAVKSILSQTHSDFELIIIDDGSTDRSVQMLRQIQDDRIVLVSQSNSGMAGALNRGLEIAKGEFLARMDADDISYPTRLKKQIAFFQQNPHHALVGTWARIIPEKPVGFRFHRHPLNSSELKFFLLFDNPFVHSSVMIRKSFLNVVGKYDPQKSSLTQDYDLWSRISRHYEIANLGEVLQDYREVSRGISKTTRGYAGIVMEQSIENIVSAAKGLSREHAVDLACLYHGQYERLSENCSLEKITDNLNLLAGELNGSASPYLEIMHKRYKRLRRYGKWYTSARNLYLKFKN